MYQQRLIPWIVGTAAICAGFGAWFGQQIGDGGGTIALISMSCAVLGSFLPGAVLWLRVRRRNRGRPHHGAA